MVWRQKIDRRSSTMSYYAYFIAVSLLRHFKKRPYNTFPPNMMIYHDYFSVFSLPFLKNMVALWLDNQTHTYILVLVCKRDYIWQLIGRWNCWRYARYRLRCEFTRNKSCHGHIYLSYSWCPVFVIVTVTLSLSLSV